VSEPPARAGDAARTARPPLGRWGRMYALVIAALLLDVALLWWLTERYR
jgi:hypothetical protein